MDETTLIQTYRDTVQDVYRFVSIRCGGDGALAEDVTQETWLRAVKAWRNQGMPDHPLAWLKTVARNLLSNHFRRLPPISLETLPPDWSRLLSENGRRADDPDHAVLLSWGLARMKPSQARLLEAFHLDGRAVRDIAADLGISERAVEGRLRRARLKLRKHLEPVVGSNKELEGGVP
jgi:RNA polymerase sigma-70 factor (ECF subfamily)